MKIQVALTAVLNVTTKELSLIQRALKFVVDNAIDGQEFLISDLDDMENMNGQLLGLMDSLGGFEAYND